MHIQSFIWKACPAASLGLCEDGSLTASSDNQLQPENDGKPT